MHTKNVAQGHALQHHFNFIGSAINKSVIYFKLTNLRLKATGPGMYFDMEEISNWTEENAMHGPAMVPSLC